VLKLNPNNLPKRGQLNRACRFSTRRVILLAVVFCIWSIRFSGSSEVLFAGGGVPEKGAVCELDEREFTVRGANKGVLRVHKIFRIYNQAGKKYGFVLTKLNKFIKADKLKAELRNLDGEVIKKLGKDDVHEASLFPGYVLYADDRAKYFDLSATTFSYLLEYSYEVKYESLFYWPSWFPQSEILVERSIYTLTVPQDFVFQLQKHNLKVEPAEKAEGGKRQLIFELTQIPPFEPEKNMPPEMDHRMAVLFAPSRFDLDGYQGSTDSWDQIGKWYASLARKQYKLSSGNRQLVGEMVAHCPSARDTVRTVYQYIQRKTRYVAISLGIGGYQPREAESVITTGYGDCKDLSTLFITMLESIGREAFPVLIRTSDEGSVLADFPSNQFNHAIACVPADSDTLWLDCTCAYCPFGELPWQDEGCRSLVVTGDTAVLISTPTSSAEENRRHRSVHAVLLPDGALEIEGTISATGNFESYYRGLLNSCDQTEKTEWLRGLIGSYAPNHKLTSSDFESVPDLDRPFSIGFAARLNGYATTSGNELLLNLNLLSRVDAEDIPREEERKYPVDHTYAYGTVDELTLDLPENLIASIIPDDRELTSPWGSFQTSCHADSSRLTYRRTRTVTQRLVLPASFEDYKEFLSEIYAADQSFVVLKRAE
jgi:hypothetical protein